MHLIDRFSLLVYEMDFPLTSLSHGGDRGALLSRGYNETVGERCYRNEWIGRVISQLYFLQIARCHDSLIALRVIHSTEDMP